MKAILLASALALMSSQAVLAQSHTVETLNEQNQKVIIEISDREENKGDTLSITTQATEEATAELNLQPNNDSPQSISVKLPSEITEEVMKIVLGMLLLVFLPIIILAIVLFFSYRNRRNKYRLAEKMIENGQPVPGILVGETKVVAEGSTADTMQKSLYERGVRNICIGLVTTVFIYLLVDELALACIGLFVVANGVTQLITYRHMIELKQKSDAYRVRSYEHRASTTATAPKTAPATAASQPTTAAPTGTGNENESNVLQAELPSDVNASENTEEPKAE